MPLVLEQTRAERARSVVADARSATLTSGGPRVDPTRAHPTQVEVEDLGDGVPLVWLDPSEAPDARLVARLALCRVVTLALPGPAYGATVRMVVSLRMRRPDQSGRRAYEPTILSVRLDDAAGTVTVPVDEFLRVAAEPARRRRRALVAHLEAWHGNDLTDAVRAAGPGCDLALAGNDSGLGIEVSYLGPDGAGRLALAYDDHPGDVSLASVCGCVSLR